MSLQAKASQNAAASEQAASTPSGCKACQRQGVAIYPLRVAAVPKSLVSTGWHPAVPTQETELTGGEFKYALRTLREGYVYVLLDNTVWLGYQVTAEGALRQFNADEMPEEEKVESLSPACLTQNHEILASFINIDPKYKKAAVAFSSDPWSKTVLEEYQSGKRPVSRFTQLTLAGGVVTAQDANRSLTLDPSLSAFKSHVLEFATESFPSITGKEGAPNGAHGFSPCMAPEKQTALGNRIAQLSQKYNAPVTALVLDDQVGVVQELNGARMDCVQALALFTAKTDNIHQKMISDAILQIKTSTTEQIANDPSIKAFTTPGYNGSYTASRETQVAIKVRKALSRMEDYYSETQRAEFERTYQSTIDGYNRKIVAIWQDLNAAYRASLWLALLKNDYAPQTSAVSWVAQLRTITRCLQGSVAGFDMANTGKDSNKPVWAEWLEDAKSPPYLALLRSNPGVSDLPSQVFGGSLTYANLKAVLNSQEISKFINSKAYQQMIASLITSITGACSKLNNVLSAQAKSGMVRVLEAVAFASNGGPVTTVFSGVLTVREYQDVMRRQLDAHGKPAWNIKAEENGRVIRSSRIGHWSEITDPAILKRKILVRLTAPLNNSGSLTGTSGVSPDIIDRSLKTGEIPLSEMDMRKVARQPVTVSTDLQSGSLGVILAGIMLYATYRSLDDLKTAMPGDKQSEMSLASKSLIIMASAVEIVGQSAAVVGVFKNGDLLIKGAGVIGGIAAIVDGIALGVKAYDLLQVEDTTAAMFYGGAAGATLASGIMGAWFGAAGNFALFGPVGWCIALGILAVTLVAVGDLFVRSPLERWLSQTCFGDDHKSDTKKPMWHKESLADMQEAMTQLHIIASGMSAQLSGDWATELMSNTRLLGNRMVAARVTLADCNPAGSDWLVELTATGGGSRLLLARSASPAKLAGLTPPTPQIYQKMPIPPGSAMERMGTIPSITDIKAASSLAATWGVTTSNTPHGLQLDGEFPLNTAHYTCAELTVTYWPDKNQQDDSLQLTTQLNS
ncbi:hypothetical protein GE278_22455 (plasmid) [Enterobacteriaceae bacterium Kacie_13]|nr:hypothetical protein GE278_22455 [Enterobacteriaceae bacterium Kacie_13]